jgi:8-oxo-dGTP pyrophosphatase MutT (NUDIX family)
VPFFAVNQEFNVALLLFDPQTSPIDSVAGEAPIVLDQLRPESLRRRFGSPPPWQPETTDEHMQGQGRSRTIVVAASVLIPIVLRDAGPTLIFTQRTAHLSNHAGQVSFPGGRSETSDLSPIDTALRETEEEIGLSRNHVEVVGTLPDYVTVTGYRITPVVGIAQPPFSLQPDPREVDEIFEVPLAFLMDGMHHQRRTADLPNGLGRRTFYAMPYQRFFIWGATAGILRNLYHFLRA